MQTGERPLGSYFATDIDTVSMTNGNLHLSMPLFNLPGREVSFRLAMDYNSKFLEPRTANNQTVWDFSRLAQEHWTWGHPHGDPD